MAYANGPILTATNDGSHPNGFTSSAIDTTGMSIILFAVAWESSTITVSDSKSCTWTMVHEELDGYYGLRFLRIYAAYAPNVGTGHTFTVSGTAIYASAIIRGYSGSHASPFGAAVSNHGFGEATIKPGSLNPTESDMLLVTVLGGEGIVNAPTIDAGFTVRANIIKPGYGATEIAFADQIQTSIVARDPTWTGDYCVNAIHITFKPAAAGGADASLEVAEAQMGGLLMPLPVAMIGY